MYNGIKVIDADGHVMEPNELYDQYIESKYKPDLEELKNSRRPGPPNGSSATSISSTPDARSGIANPEKPLMRSGRKPKVRAQYARRLESAGQNQGHDREGIDVAVVFATVVSSFCALKSVEFELAMIRAYHRWLADYCSAYPNRSRASRWFRCVRRSCAAAKSVASRKSHGASASTYPGIWRTSSSTIRGSIPFGSVPETDLPACFHGGTARPPYGCGTFEIGNNLFIQHSATNPFEVMRGIASSAAACSIFIRSCGRRSWRRASDGSILDGAPR